MESKADSSLARAPSDLSVAKGVPKDILSILSGFESGSSTAYGDSSSWWLSELFWRSSFVEVSPESSGVLFEDISCHREINSIGTVINTLDRLMWSLETRLFRAQKF